MRYHLLALSLLAFTVSPSTHAHEEIYRFETSVSDSRPATGAWERLRALLLGEKPAESADLTVMVRDSEGQPLSGALVLVGSRAGTPPSPTKPSAREKPFP
jgi:hypothetical protein